MKFQKILKNEIRELVEEIATSIVLPTEIFADLPDVCTPKELSEVYKVSEEVVIR